MLTKKKIYLLLILLFIVILSLGSGVLSDERIVYAQEEGGAISGEVVTNTGDPVIDLFVEACPFYTEGQCYYAWTNVDGSYSINPLAPGDYRVQLEQSDDWRREYYQDTPYWDKATPVSVNSGENHEGINFILEPGGTITGWVRDANGYPIPNIHVAACDYNDDNRCWWAFEQSTVDGSYTIPGLATGTYRVQAYSSDGGYWVGEFYNDIPDWDWDQATRVSVNEGDKTQDINFELALGGAISGIVETNTGDLVEGLFVEACPFYTEGHCYYAWTNANGSYSIFPIWPGDYRVQVEQSDGWRREYYQDTPYWDQATPVNVNPGGNHMGIDFILEPGGTITGWVRDADGNPIPGIHVAACDYDDGNRCWWAFEQSTVDGSYTIPGLSTGTYRVQAYSSDGGYWVGEFYKDELTWDDAKSVKVKSGKVTHKIDFTLEPDFTP